MSKAQCRFCDTPLKYTFLDLGSSPLCESFLTADQVGQMESFYPLQVHVCTNCFLVQLEEFVQPESIFSEYAYFSSYSDTWLDHSRKYVQHAIETFSLDNRNFVVEIASNDGYLLQYFIEEGIPVLGIEPAANVAEVAKDKGVSTIVEFFNEELASQLVKDGYQADLLIGNNILAQVPDLNGFVSGMNVILKADGVFTLEFPHLVRLIEGNQFDTIYHEHFSYFSFTTVEKILTFHGFKVFDVDELSTHGGSLRIYGCHIENSTYPVSMQVGDLRAREEADGVNELAYYDSFAEKVRETKRALLGFLIEAKRSGKTIAGYGAPGKGNTLLNYCGIRTDFLDFTVDRNPYKHGKYTPGTHIPIFPPDFVNEKKPDYLLILPWNLKNEIMEQMAHIREWGGRFVVPIPEVQVYP